MPGLRTWRWYAAACVVGAIVYLLVPWNSGQAGIATLHHFSVVLAIVVGVRRYRPHPRWPWYALATSVAFFAAGDVAYWMQTTWDQDTFPSVADALYIPSNLTLIAALLGFGRARRTSWDRAGLLDATVLSIGAGMLAWLYLISPTAHGGDLSVLGRTVSLTYPILDLLALAVLLRLTIGAGRHPVAYRLLVVGVATLLVTEVVYLMLELAGGYTVGGLLDIGWMLAHALLGVAALHPSMPAVSQPAPSAPEGALGRRRLYGLAAASMMAPLVLIIEWLRGDAIDVPVIAGGSIALYLLVLTRLQGVVDQLAQSLETARSQAHTDLLTGLANRRLFHTRWEQALHRVPTALLYVDLDGFKAVNDTLGHETGDAVLQTVADRIRQVVRAGDVVARLGGDEFAVMLPGASDHHADAVATRILGLICEPILVEGTPVSVGASIGVIIAPPGADPDAEISRADAAMYSAKNEGRGRVSHA